ncbi:MAG: hypothetical protein KJ626_10215, partial [Verrucomicrobia bacterium]|nr:hypothetical protein [Verrucomicrobiota bacterium]
GGTNYIDQSISSDVAMNGQDISGLGSSNVTISSGSYGGVEGFKIVSGTNNYWLLLQEDTGDTFSSLTIGGVEYTTAAIINAGSNITIRTSGGAAFLDSSFTEVGLGTLTSLNIEGSNYTESAIIYAGSNMSVRVAGGTNFLDSTDTDTTYTGGTNIDLVGTSFNLDAAAQASDDLADSSMQDLADDTTPVLGADLDADSNIITNYGTPTAANHVIDKGYADTTYAPIAITPVDSRDATNNIEMATNDVTWTETNQLTAAIAGGSVATNESQITGFAGLTVSGVSNLLDGESSYADATSYYRTDDTVATDNGTWWFMYDFGIGSNTAITKYIVQGWSVEVEPNMDQWDFKGSTNGSSWTTLDSPTNQATTLKGTVFHVEGIITQEFANAVAYRYYLFTNIYLAATATASTDIVRVSEIELHSPTTPATYSTNIYYALNGETNDFTEGQNLIWKSNHVVAVSNAYGQLYIQDGTNEYSLTATYQAVTGMTATNCLNITATTSNLTTTVAGVYYAAFSINGALDNNESAEAAIFVDGVEAPHIESQASTPATGTDHINVSAAGLLDLAAAQVVDLRVKSLDAAADGTPTMVSLTMHRIGE